VILQKARPERTVSVVIPTVGRPTLTAAVMSALAQNDVAVTIVIVVDGPDTGVVPADIVRLHQVQVLASGGGRGPGGARMIGVRAAETNLIAFLDDDDEWLPDKLKEQIDVFARLRERCEFPVVSCRAQVINDDGSVKTIAPFRTLDPDTELASFMFDKHEMLADGFVMGSSTILSTRNLLMKEPWDEQRRLHEDWEWLLRVSRRDDVVVALHAEPLIKYLDQVPERSASRPVNGWRSSMAFADISNFSKRTRGDFLLCITAGMAIAHHQRVDAARVAWYAARTSRPGACAWAIFLIQMAFPPDLLGRWARRLRAVLPNGQPGLNTMKVGTDGR
jgi:glycosyltransferase involved in cell wall biosynthesis